MSFVKRISSIETKCWLFPETSIEVKEEHPEKALSPIIVTLFGIVIEVKEEQYSNALPPIVVTLFGMLMEVKERQ